MKKMSPVVRFEMPSEDRDRMSDFYTNAFGWKTNKLGEDMSNYVMVTTTEIDEQGMSKTPGTINGGFYPKTEDMPAQHPSIVIGVDDINMSMKDINEAGGKVLGEPMEIPGYGKYVTFMDTEGNRLSILQPVKDRNKEMEEHQHLESEKSNR